MTAIPRSICDLIDDRDSYSCVRCGVSLSTTTGSRHHRQRRAVGLHDVSNLVLLCGSGSTGCHGWVHAHPEAARAAGWIVRAVGVLTPGEVPVQVVSGGLGSQLIWVMLSPQGRAVRIPDSTAHGLIRPNL